MQGMLLPPSNVKLSLSPQQNSPKINVLQNISVPSVKSEIKSETFDVQSDEENEEVETLSPQPGCSNENQLPTKVQRSVVATIKSNQGVVVKPGDLHKSIKLCPRKTIAKPPSAGQKLIVVSTPQSVTPSMLHRALTVPVVKNLDKFKIVSTTTGTGAALPITAVKSVGTNATKHKVVTVRTNTLPKKVSLSHLQFLNAKGSIKVLPFGGKIITKATTLPTSNLIIVNSGECKTNVKSIASTPVILSTGSQESLAIKPTDDENSIDGQSKDEPKSAVLAEILKASGVVPIDVENSEEESSNQVIQTEQPCVTQEGVVQDITVNAEQLEENGDFVEMSLENATSEQSSVEQVVETADGIGGAYMILGKI